MSIGGDKSIVKLPKTMALPKEDSQMTMGNNEEISADLTETTRNIKRKFMNRRQTVSLIPEV